MQTAKACSLRSRLTATHAPSCCLAVLVEQVLVKLRDHAKEIEREACACLRHAAGPAVACTGLTPAARSWMYQAPRHTFR